MQCNIKIVKKIISYGLAFCIIASLFNGIVVKADSWPDIDDSQIKSAQPHFSGYRIRDIEQWNHDTDPYADLMRAEVPLQTRNQPFSQTQANPDLTAPAEVMLMQADYGNSFFDSTIANNAYGNLAFNFWQYTDYFSPWHGAATIGTPRGLYDPVTSDWRARGFEFGIVNIPNQAYINAAHKNGVKAIACVYFDPNFRPGQTKQESFVKDENGRYIVADQLIEMAKYYGIDGYFLNNEEFGEDEFKPFMAQITASGLYTQFYDTNSSFNAAKSRYLKNDELGRIHDSVFVNYGWHGVDNFVEHAKEIGVDPYKSIFLGIEANQGKFKESRQTRIFDAYNSETDKNLKASVALFTPSDMYQRGVDALAANLGLSKQLPVHQRNEYQWMVAERERMYFSGVKNNPKDTGKHSGYSRPDVAVSDASGWVGVADFKIENSVISGNQFFSNFNIGKGVQYFEKGKMINNEAWTNLNDQDILPTWQWWIDSEADQKLKADFDFGSADIHNDTKGQPITLPYTQVGAWNGGNSLVVYGDLKANQPNFLHLFKTDLDVKENSKMRVMYRKSSNDDGAMKLGLIFKENPETVEKLEITKINQDGDWIEGEVDLSQFNGKKVAVIGFDFESEVDVENYQMNIGQVQFTDDSNKLAAPTNFHIKTIYDDNQAIFGWDKKPYSEVDKYRLYAVQNGERHFLGGIYDDVLYVKNHFCNHTDDIQFELVAVGKDGIESEPATINYEIGKMPQDITVAETVQEDTKVKHAVEQGKLEISWQAGTEENDGYQISVKPLWLAKDNPDYHEYTQEVAKDTTSITLETPEMIDGYEYDLTIAPKINGQYDQTGSSYRGRFFDGYAKPMTENDIKFEPGNRLSLKSPLTRDWRYVTVEFENTETGAKQEIFKKQRGVDRNYHDSIQLPAAKGLIHIILEDYSKNKSELKLDYDESFKEDLSKLIKSNKVIVENPEISKVLYSNDNIDELIQQLQSAISKAEELIKKFGTSKAEVVASEQEINTILAKFTKADDAYVLNFNLILPEGVNQESYNEMIHISLRDSDGNEIKQYRDKEFVVKSGDYNYHVSDTYNYYIFPIDKTITVDDSLTEDVAIERIPSSIEISVKPDKLEYKRGEEIDLTGGKVKLIYSYPASPAKEIDLPNDDFEIKDGSTNILGDKTIVISGYKKSAEFVVKVLPAEDEIPEVGELFKEVENVKKVLDQAKYVYATKALKDDFASAYTKAQELLADPSAEAKALTEAKEQLINTMNKLDGEKNKPVAFEVSSTDEMSTYFDASKLFDGSKDMFAWFTGMQDVDDEILITYEKEVKFKGLNIEYPSRIGTNYIKKADIEIKKGDEWVKVGEISGNQDQTVEFTDSDDLVSNQIRLRLTEAIASNYRIGELKIDYQKIEEQSPLDKAKTELTTTISGAEEVMNSAEYYNADTTKKEAFDQTLANAKSLYQQEDADVDAVLEIIHKLTDQQKDLNGVETNKEVIKAETKLANELKEDIKYINASEDKKAAFDEILEMANQAMDKENATQDEVDGIVYKLNLAKQELDGKEQVLIPYIPNNSYTPDDSYTPAVREEQKVEISESKVPQSSVVNELSSEHKALVDELVKKGVDKEEIEKVRTVLSNKSDFETKIKATHELKYETIEKVIELSMMPFTDVKSTDWFIKDLNRVYLLDLVKGYEDGSFKPNNNVTGKEWVAQLVRIKNNKIKQEDKDWFSAYQQEAEKQKLLDQVNFSLDKELTREEMVFLAYNFLKEQVLDATKLDKKYDFKDQAEVNPEYTNALKEVYEYGIVNGYLDHNFKPKNKVTRSESVAILNRILDVISK